MKVSIQDGPFTYMVDWSTEDKVKDGWLEEYNPSTEELFDAVIQLLECIHSGEDIEKEMRKYLGLDEEDS